MQILPALNSGGVERGVIDISKAVAEAGFESIVVSNGGSMIQKFNNSKVKHIQLPLHRKNPLAIYLNSKRLEKIIKDYQVDLIHIRSRSPAWSAYFAYKKIIQNQKCQIISTFHGYYSLNLFGKKISKWKSKYNSIMVKPKFIIAVSGFIKNYIYQHYSVVEDLSGKKIEVIHRGADLNYFCNSKVPQSRIVQLVEQWDLPDDKQIIMDLFDAIQNQEYAALKMKNGFPEKLDINSDIDLIIDKTGLHFLASLSRVGQTYPLFFQL